MKSVFLPLALFVLGGSCYAEPFRIVAYGAHGSGERIRGDAFGNSIQHFGLSTDEGRKRKFIPKACGSRFRLDSQSKILGEIGDTLSELNGSAVDLTNFLVWSPSETDWIRYSMDYLTEAKSGRVSLLG
jgi:hypothetical protein